MNLNNLKPAWKQFLFFNSMEPLDSEEILYIIELADQRSIVRLPRRMVTLVTFITLMACCHGG